MDARNINWSLAKKLALQAIEGYDEKEVPKWRALFSSNNKMRVINLKIYLKETQTKKEFIAAMLAISGDFDKTFLGINFNSSKKLMGLIAECWIKGCYVAFTPSGIENPVSSTVFSRELIDSTMDENLTLKNHIPIDVSYGEYNVYAPVELGYGEYDKLNAAKDLLKRIVELDFTQSQKLEVFALAKSLSSRFAATKPLGLISEEASKLWTTAAVAGALFNASMQEVKAQPNAKNQTKTPDRKPLAPTALSEENPFQKIPASLLRPFSEFLMLKDAACLVGVRRNAKVYTDAIEQESKTQFIFKK